MKAPFVDGPMMEHLLGYSDFHRHKTVKRRSTQAPESDSGRLDGTKEGNEEEDDECISERTDTSLGHANLNNTKADTLESDEKFSHVVDPMCDLRGMDLFLTDDPEEDIWLQPLLTQ